MRMTKVKELRSLVQATVLLEQVCDTVEVKELRSLVQAAVQAAVLLEQVCDTVDQEDLDEAGEATDAKVDEGMARIARNVPDGNRTLHLIPGLPGSGKTTFAQDLLRRTPGLVLVSSKQLRTMLGCGHSMADGAFVERAAETVILAAVADGRDVVTDACLLNEGEIDRMTRFANLYGIRIHAHPQCLRTPRRTCIRRIIVRDSLSVQDADELARLIGDMAPRVRTLWGHIL